MLFQGLFQVSHEVQVNLPALSPGVVVELAGGGEGGQEVCQHADPGFGVLQGHVQDVLQLCLPCLQVSSANVEEGQQKLQFNLRLEILDTNNADQYLAHLVCVNAGTGNGVH